MAAFLNICTRDPCSQMTICCGVFLDIVGSLQYSWPLPSRWQQTAQLGVTTEMSLDIARWPPGGQNCPSGDPMVI